jgi:hypothetical protein
MDRKCWVRSWRMLKLWVLRAILFYSSNLPTHAWPAEWGGYLGILCWIRGEGEKYVASKEISGAVTIYQC